MHVHLNGGWKTCITEQNNQPPASCHRTKEASDNRLGSKRYSGFFYFFILLIKMDKNDVYLLLIHVHKNEDHIWIQVNMIWATAWQNEQNDCVPSEDSDQPGHPSLIRVFSVRIQKGWVLSYPFSAQRRLIRLGGYCGSYSMSVTSINVHYMTSFDATLILHCWMHKVWQIKGHMFIAFAFEVMGLKDADRMANSVDPNQTAPRCSQSDLGLHCLLSPVCPKT